MMEKDLAVFGGYVVMWCVLGTLAFVTWVGFVAWLLWKVQNLKKGKE